MPFELAGRRVTVMGLGRFGGGVGAVNYLLRQGAIVTVTDLLPESALAQSLAQLRPAATGQLQLQLGRHDERDFREADLVVVNPAVKPGNPFVATALACGVPVTSELNLFWERQRGQIIAVTGTVGKSTTSALIAHMLRSDSNGRVRLGGNIGTSLLSEVDQIEPEDWTILEVSSFQLELLAPLCPRPEIGVITNFFPNHLDWHGSVEHYRQAKQRLIAHLSPGQFFVTPVGGEPVNWSTDGQRMLVDVDDSLGFTWSWSRQLPGRHNRQNVALALAACSDCLGLDRSRCMESLTTFEPLPHRLELIGEHLGRSIYNDSKATTPEAAIEALNAFASPIRLIAGGADKGVSLGEMAKEIIQRAASASLIGATADLLASQILEIDASFPVARHATLAAAANCEWLRSDSGDVVLLSPGCASFGEFQNYEERGLRFRQWLAELAAQ